MRNRIPIVDAPGRIARHRSVPYLRATGGSLLRTPLCFRHGRTTTVLTSLPSLRAIMRMAPYCGERLLIPVRVQLHREAAAEER